MLAAAATSFEEHDEPRCPIFDDRAFGAFRKMRALCGVDVLCGGNAITAIYQCRPIIF
jgi:hypothetical protein